MDYSEMNLYQGTRAPTGEVIRSQAGAYFWRCLYQRLTSTIDFKLPASWEKNYFKNVLFGLGFIGVIPSAKYGTIPQFCTLTGYGIYKQPVELRVSSPLIQYTGKIGIDCELIRLTPDYIGVCDIVDHYADRLANLYGALGMAIENSKLATLFFPHNQAAAQAIKCLMERISSGEARVFADKLLKDDIAGQEDFTIHTTHAKENYIVDQILADMQTVVSEFDREIGIPTIPGKKERYTSDEIAAVTSDSAARLSLWSECLTETIGRVNEMFPELGIGFTTVGEEVTGNVDGSETDTDRTV
jgi:hypothetical protein